MGRELRTITQELPATSFNTVKVRNVSVLAYAQGFTAWHASVDFDIRDTTWGRAWGMSDMFADGDKITVSGPNGVLDLAVFKDSTNRITVRMLGMALKEEAR